MANRASLKYGYRPSLDDPPKFRNNYVSQTPQHEAVKGDEEELKQYGAQNYEDLQPLPREKLGFGSSSNVGRLSPSKRSTLNRNQVLTNQGKYHYNGSATTKSSSTLKHRSTVTPKTNTTEGEEKLFRAVDESS